MNILLINTNPVVSRLMALCTRSDVYNLKEIDKIADLEEAYYDIVFIDDASYATEIEDFLKKQEVKYKILFSVKTQDHIDFDQVIKKPFLPSQVIEILERYRENPKEDQAHLTFEEGRREETSIFPLTAEQKMDKEEDPSILKPVEENKSKNEAVLDFGEIEKIKALLEMDEEEEISAESLSEEEYEARKVEAIKEELMAQGLEIVDESRMVEEFGLDESIQSRPQKGKKKQKLTLQELKKLEMMFAYTIRNMKPKKLRKLLKGEKTKLKLKDNR